MRKTLSVLAIIAALSSTALATTFSGGEVHGTSYYRTSPGEVTISDGGSDSYTIVMGNFSSTDSVSGGSVNMTGGSLPLNSFIYGAETYGEGVAANGNSVTISGGSLNDSQVYAGNCDQGDAKNNSITISGGSFKDTLFMCGKADYEDGEASNNTFTIAGGTFTGVNSFVVGSGAHANNNVMNLVGEDATLGDLTGSSFTIRAITVVSGGGAGDTGNTLNVYGKNITAENINNGVDKLNFHLTPNMANGDIMLTLTTDFSLPLTNTHVGVRCSGATLLEKGDSVTLIHMSGNGIIYASIFSPTAPPANTVDVIQGVTASYSGKLSIAEDGKDLILTVGNDAPTTNDEALKSMTETRTDVAALVNSAADFMATTGVQQAKLAAKVAALAGKDGAAPFMAMGGSSMRYNTGSHVDANGFNGALGVAKAFDDITLGIAGEYGLSSYRSHVGSTSAKGDSKLYGGALLADWQDKQGWHAEGAVRLGRTSTDYSAMTALGHTHYTDHASYQGALIGGGKEFKVSRKSDDTVDLYARYMYTHTNASNTTATSGESMHFAGVDSHRTMVGARYNHELTDTAVVYAGAAWMHEFNGDAHSVIGGFTSPSPSLEGDSGMVEIGTTFAPCRSESILLNLNVQGWTGVQRGISGGAGCTIKF